MKVLLMQLELMLGWDSKLVYFDALENYFDDCLETIIETAKK